MDTKEAPLLWINLVSPDWCSAVNLWLDLVDDGVNCKGVIDAKLDRKKTMVLLYYSPAREKVVVGLLKLILTAWHNIWLPYPRSQGAIWERMKHQLWSLTPLWILRETWGNTTVYFLTLPLTFWTNHPLLPSHPSQTSYPKQTKQISDRQHILLQPSKLRLLSALKRKVLDSYWHVQVHQYSWTSRSLCVCVVVVFLSPLDIFGVGSWCQAGVVGTLGRVTLAWGTWGSRHTMGTWVSWLSLSSGLSWASIFTVAGQTMWTCMGQTGTERLKLGLGDMETFKYHDNQMVFLFDISMENTR